MKTSTEGYQQCCNTQMAVDDEHLLIVATQVNANASDQGRLLPLLDAVKEHFQESPATVLADTGFCNEKDLEALEDRGVDGYVSLGREDKQSANVAPDRYPAKARMQEKLATEEGRGQYRQRKWLSEAPNGWIKEVLGFRRFSLRGLEKARAEWDLVCLALNLKRLNGFLAA